MARDFDDAVSGLRELRPEYAKRRIMVTGYVIDPVTNATEPDPTSRAQPGHLYVHGYPRGANVQVLAGTRINPRVPNVLVKVGENDANQAVAYDAVIDEKAVAQWGAGLPAITTNPTPIDTATQETPLSLSGGGRVLPVNTPSPGQFVFVEAFDEAGWAGGNIAVASADFPTNPNEFRFAVFRFPLAGRFSGTYMPTYALTTDATSPTVTQFVTQHTADAATLLLDAGDIRAGIVTLANGQTDLTVAGGSIFINDLRRDFVPEGDLLSGTPVSRTIAAGALTTGGESVIVVSPTATLSTITLTGAPRFLWLIGDTGVTVTLATGGNLTSAAIVTDTDSVLIYHDGTTGHVLGGGGTGGGDATTVTYTPTTPADWPAVPTDVQEALDTLAADVATGGINKDLYTQTTNVTVANTTTPTTLLGAGQGSSLIPANYFVTGRTLVLDFAGTRSTALVAPNVTFEIDLGSTAVAVSATFADVGSLSGQQYHGHVEITCLTAGASGTVNAVGWVELNSTATVAVRAEMTASNPVTLDTTSAQQAKALLTWGTASASSTATNTNARLQTVDPNIGTGGGSLTQAYLGYNTVGGSNEIMTAGKVYMKKITLAAAGLLADIEVYIDHSATTNVQSLVMYLMDDNAGVPDKIIQIAPFLLTNTYYPNTAGRWVGMPMGRWLAAGDYWIAAMRPASSGTNLRIYYDTSGSDRTMTTGSASSLFWIADGSLYTQTNSTNKYSMRANLLK